MPSRALSCESDALTGPEDAVSTLLGARAADDRRLATLLVAWYPEARTGDPGRRLSEWFRDRTKSVSESRVGRLVRSYGNPALTLADYGYLLGKHPLEVWTAGQLVRDLAILRGCRVPIPFRTSLEIDALRTAGRIGGESNRLAGTGNPVGPVAKVVEAHGAARFIRRAEFIQVGAIYRVGIIADILHLRCFPAGNDCVDGCGQPADLEKSPFLPLREDAVCRHRIRRGAQHADRRPRNLALALRLCSADQRLDS